ncbi:hypothetical protein SAMN05428952_100463 [Nitrosomonas sp. Nm132]|nr:hypothetical protein SAMN05428952_100463 [Nitrosomonas sp. Nm132]
MKNHYSRRHFPRRHTLKKVVETSRPRLATWIGRIVWFIVGGLVSLFVAFLSQGPDAIRKIPEIPRAVSETVNSLAETYQIDRDLTATWEFVQNQLTLPTQTHTIRLELTSKDGRIAGELYSPSIRKWTIYDMALVEGRRNGRSLHLTVFDFIHGKRTRLAELDVRFQEEPNDGITDHVPALVNSELRVTTVWQKDGVLPKTFVIHRVSK